MACTVMSRSSDERETGGREKRRTCASQSSVEPTTHLDGPPVDGGSMGAPGQFPPAPGSHTVAALAITLAAFSCLALDRRLLVLGLPSLPPWPVSRCRPTPRAV